MKALLSRFCKACLLCLVVVIAATTSARADEDMLAAASRAWDAGQTAKAAVLYETAVEQGLLYPGDASTVFMRIGIAAAVKANNSAAMNAFRVALAVDPDTELPREANAQAKKVFASAKTEASKRTGKLQVRGEVPEQVKYTQGFTVKAQVPEAFLAVVTDVAISVRDPGSPNMKPFTAKQPVAAMVSFDVPRKAVVAGATMAVRLDLLDEHGNRLAFYEARIPVTQRPQGGAIETVGDGSTPTKKSAKKSQDFWGTPWPWVIGAAVVVGVVVGASVAATRSSDVTVAAPHWQITSFPLSP